MTGEKLPLRKMYYIHNFWNTVYDYVRSFFCKEKEPIPLNPREKIVFEDYMLKKDLQELNDIFSYVRKKENALKEKCKHR